MWNEQPIAFAQLYGMRMAHSLIKFIPLSLSDSYATWVNGD